MPHPKTVSRAYRYALFPTKEQERLIAVNCDSARYIYNHFLALRAYEYDLRRGYSLVPSRDEAGDIIHDDRGNVVYEQTPVRPRPDLDAELKLVPLTKTGKKKFGPMAMSKLVTSLRHTAVNRDGEHFLEAADSIASGYAYRHLDAAFQRFFDAKRVAKAEGRTSEIGYPRFKKPARVTEDGIYRDGGSYTTGGWKHTQIDWEHKRVRLLKIGWVKFDAHRTFDAPFSSTTVTRNSDGTYAISFTVQNDPYVASDAPTDEVGVITGISTKLAVSNGTIYENPKALIASQKKLARLQRRLSRKQGYRKGEPASKGYIRVKRQVSRLQSHIAEQRRAFAHQVANDVIANAGVIHIAKPKVRNVVESAKRDNAKTVDGKLTKSAIDAGAYQLYQMIRYKADWNDRALMEPIETEGLRTTCPVCGHVNTSKPRAGRTFVCEECGHTEHVDVMAARAVLERPSELVEPDSVVQARKKAAKEAKIAAAKAAAAA